MNWILSKFILIVFIAASAIPSTGYSAKMCRNLFISVVDKVFIPDEEFNAKTDNLRATLSGKLATVWRSEWKTKLSVAASNQYILNLTKQFLTEKTQQIVLKDLDIHKKGFTQEVHARLFDLQSRSLLHPEDELAVRDKPAPAGAKDTTFTYYTKPIQMSKSDGKHQVRIRTYLRQIDFSKMILDQSIQAFTTDGKLISFTKNSSDHFKVEVGTDKDIESSQLLSLEQVISQFGARPQFFAPHGKNFKLEIKTALSDIISGEEYPNLGGNHMVQKLDLGLSFPQVAHLFALSKNKSALKVYNQSIDRIDALTSELVAQDPKSKVRIESVFDVIKAGLDIDANFLKVVGATAYHRTAFETKSGLQTTVDRDQSVYIENMYLERSLKDPAKTIAMNVQIKTGKEDARHVELKIPVTAMAKSIGITYANPQAAPPAQEANNYVKIRQMIEIFNQFVKNSFHAGKFNYIRKNGDSNPEI